MDLQPHQRIKKLRQQSGLTRKAFEEKFGFSQHTLRALESDERPLTRKKAILLSAMFSSLGIACSEDYILTGLCEEKTSDSQEGSRALSILDQEMMIYKEVEVFQHAHVQHLIMKIDHAHFTPFFYKGDIVGGLKTSMQGPLDPAQSNFFILELSPHKKVVRKIMSYTDQCYVCLKPCLIRMEYEVVEALSIARITRHWRVSEL